MLESTLLGCVPVNYDSNARQESLPNYLVERGDLPPPHVEAVLKALSGGLRIGAALAEAGVDLQGEALHDKLSDYTREKLAQVIGLREGCFAFHAGNEFASEVAAVAVSALAPVRKGARRAFSLKIFAQALKRPPRPRRSCSRRHWASIPISSGRSSSPPSSTRS